MITFERIPSIRGAIAAPCLLLLLSLFMSCASLKPSLHESSANPSVVLEIRHAHSTKSSDCLAVCVGMVLKYYNVDMALPDTALPLELSSVSRQLNTSTPVDPQGHVLFATVLELGPSDIAAQLAKSRPLILAFKPSARSEYHSVVVSGYSPEKDRFLIHDPARRKPHWKSISKVPTFSDTGKYLVLLIGLREM